MVKAMVGDVEEKCLAIKAAREEYVVEREKEEEGGAVKVGGATVADVRQTRRQAVDENPSRAKGGRARAIGCVDCV